jgi:hypothetical protein
MSSCEHDNKRESYIKDGEFLDQLSDYHLVKNGSAPVSLLFNAVK